VSGQDVQGVNSATLVVRELATVALKEADTYLPTNLVPLHIIMFGVIVLSLALIPK